MNFFSQENCESARIEYLDKNPDVKKAGIDPWTHYNYYGKNEGRVWPNCKGIIKNNTNPISNDTNLNYLDSVLNSKGFTTDLNSLNPESKEANNPILLKELSIGDYSLSTFSLKSPDIPVYFQSNGYPIATIETCQNSINLLHDCANAIIADGSCFQNLVKNKIIAVQCQDIKLTSKYHEKLNDLLTMNVSKFGLGETKYSLVKARFIQIENIKTAQNKTEQIKWYSILESKGLTLDNEILDPETTEANTPIGLKELAIGDISLLKVLSSMPEAVVFFKPNKFPVAKEESCASAINLLFDCYSSHGPQASICYQNLPTNKILAIQCQDIKLNSKLNEKLTKLLGDGTSTFSLANLLYSMKKAQQLLMEGKLPLNEKYINSPLNNNINSTEISEELTKKESILTTNGNQIKVESNNVEYQPKTLDELRTKIDSIFDPFDKINFLNGLLSNINKRINVDRAELTSDDLSLWFWSNIYKLNTILPNQFDSPYISTGEWESLFNFLSQTSVHEYMYKESHSYRAYYLYWFICVRQKLDKHDEELFKMVVNEFTRDDFEPSSNFYDQCKSIVDNMASQSDKGTVTRTCSYKFTSPTLTITWLDNRRKCCNPYCKEKSISYLEKEDNLKDAEIQYLKDALEAHCLEINASQEHRNLDFNALTEFINQHYYQDLPSLGTEVNNFLSIMNDVSSWVPLVSTSLLKKETNQEKISRLRSKSKKLNIYQVTKYCSKECEQICIDNEYRCD
jgi:hypothetical protein